MFFWVSLGAGGKAMEGGQGLMGMGLRVMNKGSLATRLPVPLSKSGTARLWPTSTRGGARPEAFLEGLTRAGVAKRTTGLHGGSRGPGPPGQAGPSLPFWGLL